MSQIAAQPAAASAAHGEILLRARGIRKSFQMGDSQIHILKGVDFSLRAGEFVAIEGRSGSGKSTLLHILGALESVDGGTVEFDGRDYTTPSFPDQRWWSPISWSLGIRLRFLALLMILFAAGALSGWLLQVSSHSGRIVYLSCLAAAVLCAIGLIAGAILYEHRERPRAKLRNKQFGFVFQFYYLLPELNVLENAMLAPKVEYSTLGFGTHRSALRKRAMELLDQLGMGHRLKHRPGHLSGGERQRVAIARALMNSPRILFADEPTGNLDVETGQQIMAVLEKLHRDHGQTIVMVTHDRSLARQADRVLVLKDGKLESAT